MAINAEGGFVAVQKRIVDDTIKGAKIGRVITPEDETRLAEALVDGVHPGRARKAAQMTVVPRRRGDGGVVKGMQATEPKVSTRRLKVSGTLIKNEGHLADVPATFAAAIRAAWKLDWDVQVGDQFNETERRIVISGEVGIVSLVWEDGGRLGVFVRSFDSSITRRVTGWEYALELAGDPDNWPWKNANHQCI
jgi:hypothetical protein